MWYVFNLELLFLKTTHVKQITFEQLLQPIFNFVGDKSFKIGQLEVSKQWYQFVKNCQSHV